MRHGYRTPQGDFDYEEPDFPTCPICGSGDGDWVDCPQCAGEGGFDDEQLMDDDPMWYQPGDYEKCDMCDGEGGWWQCFNAENHPDTQPTGERSSE